MNQQIREMNNLLRQDILPDAFNFNIRNADTIDISKLKYNAFYRSYEFAESKFPSGYDSIPGFDKVIESCKCTKTPLEEMNERCKVDCDPALIDGNTPSEK